MTVDFHKIVKDAYEQIKQDLLVVEDLHWDSEDEAEEALEELLKPNAEQLLRSLIDGDDEVEEQIADAGCTTAIYFHGYLNGIADMLGMTVRQLLNAHLEEPPEPEDPPTMPKDDPS